MKLDPQTIALTVSVLLGLVSVARLFLEGRSKSAKQLREETSTRLERCKDDLVKLEDERKQIKAELDQCERSKIALQAELIKALTK